VVSVELLVSGAPLEDGEVNEDRQKPDIGTGFDLYHILCYLSITCRFIHSIINSFTQRVINLYTIGFSCLIYIKYYVALFYL